MKYSQIFKKRVRNLNSEYFFTQIVFEESENTLRKSVNVVEQPRFWDCSENVSLPRQTQTGAILDYKYLDQVL